MRCVKADGTVIGQIVTEETLRESERLIKADKKLIEADKKPIKLQHQDKIIKYIITFRKRSGNRPFLYVRNINIRRVKER